MKISREGVWLTNPWFYNMFLVGFSSALVVLAMGLASKGALPLNFFVVLGFFSFFIGTAHLLSSFLIVYLDGNELRSRLLPYLWVPLLFCAVFSIFLLMGLKNPAVNLLFLLVNLHSFFQNYFIMQAYNFTQSRYSLLDVIIGNAVAILGPLYFLLKSASYLNFEYGGVMLNFSFNPLMLRGVGLLGFLVFFSIMVFIVRQAYLYFKYKKIALFNFFLVLMFNGIVYLALTVFKSEKIFNLGVIKYNHGIQYLVWLILYFQLKFKEYQLKGPEFVAGFHLPRRGIVLFLLFIFAALIYLPIIRIFNTAFRGAPIEGLPYYFIVIFHLCIDGFLWWDFRRIKSLIALNK